jgi:predicted site-specific integrase-resolvase
VDQETAAGRLGINSRTLRDWVKNGSLSYGGIIVLGPNGARARLYEVAALDSALAQMRIAHEARATMPEGFVSRDQTARMLGIAPDTVALWHTNGRLRSERYIKNAEGKRCKIYPIAEVERVRRIKGIGRIKEVRSI